MSIVLVLVALALVAGVALVAGGRGGSMASAPHDIEPADLPEDRPVAAADIERVRFAVAVRGYRMDQVDAVLDRLGREVSAREQELTILRERLGEPEPVPEAEAEAVPEAEPEPSTEMGEEAHDRG